MDIRPLHDRIIVRRQNDDDTEQRVGGGRVTDDGVRVPIDIRTGDVVLFGKYTTGDITVHGEELLILRESEVLAVLGDTPASPAHS
jgi:chaperonin GroES